MLVDVDIGLGFLRIVGVDTLVVGGGSPSCALGLKVRRPSGGDADVV